MKLDAEDVMVFGGLTLLGAGAWLQFGLGVGLLTVGAVLIALGSLLTWPGVRRSR